MTSGRRDTRPGHLLRQTDRHFTTALREYGLAGSSLAACNLADALPMSRDAVRITE
jgi:hypothetical protein